MSDTHTGQVTTDAAEVYEDVLVPAVFAEWAPRVADAARVREGDRVLDVACGTGVVAREAARRVAPGGRVVGLDRNAGMLAVARRRAPGIEWREGRAEDLPFEDASFDAVLCAFGLMYFEDRGGAVKEMRRVLRPGGRAALVVWDALENQPVEAAIVDVLSRRVGDEAADELRAPFVVSDPEVLLGLLEDAGFHDAAVDTVTGSSRAPSVEAYVEGILGGWTLADRLDASQLAAITEESVAAIEPLARREGDVVIMPAPAHVAVGVRP